MHFYFACGLHWQKKLLIVTVDIHLKPFNCDFLLLCIFAGISSKNALLTPGQDHSVDEDYREKCIRKSGGGGQNIHFGKKEKEEEWEWVREDRVTVCLCCVSCHLCVRAHHRNWEACSHTSTITMLSVGHPTLAHRRLQITAVTLFRRLAHLWLDFPLTYSHTVQ